MTSTMRGVAGPAVVPIGIFDGVHRGHQLVVAHAAAAAKERQARVVVVTFDPHPTSVLRPDAMPLMLTTIERRIELLRSHGADEVVVLTFNYAMSQQTAAEFVEHTLIERVGAVQVVVGDNFRFGNRARGDIALLREHGLDVDDVQLLGDAETITSTLIRAKVAAGDVEAAAAALGRDHLVEGPVVRGDARGRELGFPTANLDIDERLAVPADGVYAGWLTRANGQRHKAAISVGTNPTFEGVSRRVEAYVIDQGHELDLYDEHVVVEFERLLRGMQRFDNIAALVGQMDRDVRSAREILTPSPPNRAFPT